MIEAAGGDKRSQFREALYRLLEVDVTNYDSHVFEAMRGLLEYDAKKSEAHVFHVFEGFICGANEFEYSEWLEEDFQELCDFASRDTIPLFERLASNSALGDFRDTALMMLRELGDLQHIPLLLEAFSGFEDAHDKTEMVCGIALITSRCDALDTMRPMASKIAYTLEHFRKEMIAEDWWLVDYHPESEMDPTIQKAIQRWAELAEEKEGSNDDEQ